MAEDKTIHVLEGQSLLDIALQTSGDISGVASLADANDIAISSDIASVSELKCGEVINPDRTQYYNQRQIIPATAKLSTVAEDGIFGEEFDNYFE